MSQDVHYCDKCGDVMQGNFDARSQTLCMSCQGNAPKDSTSMGMTLCATTLPAATPALPTEEITNDTLAAKDLVTEELGSMSLDEIVQNEGLDLYSPDTVAIRKNSEDGGKTRLRFAEPGSVVKPRGGGNGSASGGATMVAEATTMTATMTAANPAATLATVTDGPVVTPEGKWKLQCLHCDGRLAVPPVQRKSKLRCPRCCGEQALDPSGRLMQIKGGAKAQAVASSSTVAHIDDSPAFGHTPADFAPPPAQPAMTNPKNPVLAAPVDGPAAVAAQISESLHGPALATTTSAAAPTATLDPFPASPPVMPQPSAFDTPFPSTPAETAAAEGQFLAKESEGVGNALLGSDEDFTAEQLAATLNHVRGKTNAVPVENAVMWLILASVPSFVGLYAVSELSGPEVQATIWKFGESVKDGIQLLFEKVGKFL